jgi:hypothetical protein
VTDELFFFHHVTLRDGEITQMGVNRVQPPAMIENNGIAAEEKFIGEYDPTIIGSGHRRAGTGPEIGTGVRAPRFTVKESPEPEGASPFRVYRYAEAGLPGPLLTLKRVNGTESAFFLPDPGQILL